MSGGATPTRGARLPFRRGETMRLSELEHPGRRIAALALSCFAGTSASALAVLAVLRGQRALWPSAELKRSALLAEPGSAPWIESWTLLVFWVALGFAAIFAGYLVGSSLYEWLARRYRLRKRKDAKTDPAGRERVRP